MIAVVGCVENVSVVQLPQLFQFLINPLDSNVNVLKRLQALRHQQVSEFPMNRFHFLCHTKDPLFVGVGGEVVGWRAEERKNCSRVNELINIS